MIAHFLYCSTTAEDCCLTMQDSATDCKTACYYSCRFFLELTWNSFSISGAQRVNSKFQNPYVSSLISSMNVVSRPHGCGRSATRRSNRILQSKLSSKKCVEIIKPCDLFLYDLRVSLEEQVQQCQREEVRVSIWIAQLVSNRIEEEIAS